jgi:heterotetrameric sarcosine oxidase gamma subunit
VADLAETDAFDGLDLPLAIAAARLEALPPVRRMLVAPLATGQVAGLPEPGHFVVADGGRIVWAGMGQWFFEGAAGPPDAGAALTDQTDGWAGLRLTGPDAQEVLARLVPLDLDRRAFPPGSVARSLLRHVMLLLIATDDGFELLVPRSFARTAVRELREAMRAVAGRAALTPGREGL